MRESFVYQTDFIYSLILDSTECNEAIFEMFQALFLNYVAVALILKNL